MVESISEKLRGATGEASTAPALRALAAIYRAFEVLALQVAVG